MPKFGKRSKVYPFTTENLSGYMKHLNLKNKNVLSVISSSDHILNSFYYGANEVTGFDINYLASLFAELKFNAFRKLDFDKFKKYFFIESSHPMDFETYNSIKENLSNPCSNFFDYLYKKYNFNGEDLRKGIFFNKRLDVDDLKIKSNPYLFSRTNFEKTKLNIQDKNISLINSDVRNLVSKLKKTYDIVLLSNLADYSQQIFPETSNHFNLFCENILLPIKQHLNPGGIICAAYIYNARENGSYKIPVNNPILRKDFMGNLGMGYEEFKFNSILPSKENKLDLVVVLKK